MNERSLIQPPEPNRSEGWLDPYLPGGGVAPYQQQPRLIDMPAIRGILFRQRWLMAGIIAIAAVIGLVITLLATPMYEARSTVQIEPYGRYIVEGQDVDQGIASNQVYELLATYVGVVTSRNLASSVASELNLGERDDFLGNDIDSQRPPKLSDEQWVKAKEEMAAAQLQGSVSSAVPLNTWILTISYQSEDPVIAAEMANGYARVFAASDTRETVSESEYAQEFLSSQIKATREKLSEAEQAANTYARNNGIIVQPSNADDEAGSVTLRSSNLTRVNDRASAATATRIEAEQRWRAIQNLPAAQLPEAQSNPVLQALVTDRTSKAAELAELRERYNEQFPQIRTLLAQIETLDAQISRTGADIKAGVRNRYVVARNQERALLRELSTATGATLAEQDRQVEYSVLEREAQALREQLGSLLERFNQITTAQNVDTGAIKVLDLATVPSSPYAPSLMQNMLLALVFGTALAGGLAVLRETVDDRIRSLDDIEARLGLPLLGHTPFIEERDIEDAGSNRYGSLMEAYASIRSTIDFSLPRERNVIQLTSSQESEGKSTTAVILAELFASLGRKTLLIDGDLRRPSVASLLNLEEPEVGLAEVLLGHADLASATIQGVHENLEILPIATRPSNPTELLASSQLRDFIGKCREDYDLVIFDSSPVLGLADAPMLSRLVDGTVFVAEANRIHFNHAKSALRRIHYAGGKPVGLILTKYRALEAGQSYDYQYNYYAYGEDK